MHMASYEFLCPHCSGRFALANPPPGGRAACPLCGQTLAIPAELPESLPAPRGPAAAAQETRQEEPEAPSLAFDVDAAARELASRRKRGERPVEAPRIVPLSRAEKERRRQVRSLIWMIGGVLLLAIAAIVLSRL
jgi:hypothetical protein